MSMSNEESSWPILDPLLKKPELYKDKAGLKQKSLLNYHMPLPDDQVGEELTNNNSNTAEETSNEKKSAADDLIKEIEDELEFYRYDIYTEKLKALEKELASIEEGTHKDVVASDKKALGKVKSDMSQAEEQYLLYIETIERNFETQKAEIMKDHQKELDLVNRAVNFKRHSYLDQQNNRKRTRQQIEAERREVNEPPKIPKTDFQEKLGRLQAIAERQKVMRINRNQHYINTLTPHEVDSDLLSIKRQINAQKKQ